MIAVLISITIFLTLVWPVWKISGWIAGEPPLSDDPLELAAKGCCLLSYVSNSFQTYFQVPEWKMEGT